MNYKSFPIGVHTNENSVKVLEGIVQHDNGNLFQIQLYDGTEAFDFTGYSIINVTIIRPDETSITDLWVDTGDGYERADETTEGETESHTFLAMQYLDPANGRITLQVGGDATAQVGLHRMAVEIYSSDVVLTTARINYNVVGTLNKVGASILERVSGYSKLQDLLIKCSQMIDAEEERANQEAARQNSELEREALADTLRQYMETLEQAVADAQAAAASAKSWKEAATALVITDLPVELQTAIENAASSAASFNALVARVDELEKKKVPVMASSALDAYFADAEEGAVAFCSTDNVLCVADGEGSYDTVVDPSVMYVVSSTAPSDTTKLWVDTANNNQLKAYVSDAWQPVKSVAVFG